MKRTAAESSAVRRRQGQRKAWIDLCEFAAVHVVMIDGTPPWPVSKAGRYLPTGKTLLRKQAYRNIPEDRKTNGHFQDNKHMLPTFCVNPYMILQASVPVQHKLRNLEAYGSQSCWHNAVRRWRTRMLR